MNTTRRNDDRNSDQTIGSPKVHVPYKGSEWANSLRTPETFLGPIADGGWDGRGVPSGGTSYRPASASGVGSGSGPAQSSLDHEGLFRTPIRLKGPSAGQMLMKAIDKESLAPSKAALSEAILSQSAPKYSLKTQLLIGAWIFLSIASGVALGFMKGCR